jgi:hypothetical protein
MCGRQRDASRSPDGAQEFEQASATALRIRVEAARADARCAPAPRAVCSCRRRRRRRRRPAVAPHVGTHMGGCRRDAEARARAELHQAAVDQVRLCAVRCGWVRRARTHTSHDDDVHRLRTACSRSAVGPTRSPSVCAWRRTPPISSCPRPCECRPRALAAAAHTARLTGVTTRRYNEAIFSSWGLGEEVRALRGTRAWLTRVAILVVVVELTGRGGGAHAGPRQCSRIPREQRCAVRRHRGWCVRAPFADAPRA